MSKEEEEMSDYVMEEDGLTLFPELWRIVFKELDTKTRLECKLVCDDWYDMLYDDVAFKKDRHVVLRSRYLHESHPAVLALTGSLTKFERLTFDCVYKDSNSKLDDFWKTLGRTVKKIEIVGFDSIDTIVYQSMCYNFEFLEHFEWLKEFYLHDEANYLIIDLICYSACKQSLKTVETIRIGEISTNRMWTHIKELLDNMPSLTSILILDSGSFLYNMVDVLMPHAHKIKQITYSSQAMTLLNAAHNIEHLKICHLHLHNLTEIINWSQNLKSLKTCSVDLTDYQPLLSEISSLKNFRKLKSLTIETVDDSLCFFGHDVLDLEVKNLRIKSEDPCKNCFTALMKSAKNVIDFALNARKFDLDMLNILVESQHQFKVFELHVHIMDPDLHPTLLRHLPNLTELSIHFFEKAQLEDFKDVLQYLPHMKALNLYFMYEFSKNAEKLLREIGKHLKKLEVLKIGSLMCFMDFQPLLNLLPPLIQSISFKPTQFHVCELDDMVFGVVELFQRYKDLNLLSLSDETHMYRFEIEKFEAYDYEDIGPSMHRWPLVNELLNYM